MKCINGKNAKTDVYLITFNNNMMKFLGFHRNNSIIILSKRKAFKTNIEADFKPNINAFTPKSIIVACDIVQDTIFAGERLKLLRLINNNLKEVKYDTFQYDFKQDEYVDLSTHEFDRITIRICDVTGQLLQSDNVVTRLLLEFREVT